MKNFNYIVLAVFVLLMFIPAADIFAQCSHPALGLPNGSTCCDGGDPTLCSFLSCPPCTDAPLDGGLSALLIAGVAYGAKKVRSKLN